MRRAVFGAFLLLAGVLSCAAEMTPDQMLAFINGPDRTDIPYHIKVLKPTLMFQQQYLLTVVGKFSKKVVKSGVLGRLQIVVKLQDEAGRWLDGGMYGAVTVPEKGKGQEILYRTAIYVRPGKYKVCVVTSGGDTTKTNVYHQSIEIPPLHGDPFPVLDELLPVAEFPKESKDVKGWPLSSEMRPLRLKNARPTRLDIVLNITNWTGWGPRYRYEMNTVLDAGSVLGRFRLANGCVRLSIIDAMRLKVVMDRVNVEKLNWNQLQESVATLDQNTINVRVLANQRKVAQFVHDHLQRLAAEKDGCTTADHAAPRVVVVSPDLVLPDGGQIGSMSPMERDLYVYLHLGFGSSWMDGVGQILSSGKPVKVSGTNPREMRSALAKIASTIEGSEE
jgi:hypothetical protein